MANRISKAEKEHYRIGVKGDGCWYGMCPSCPEVFSATHVSVNQAAIVYALRKHEEEMHEHSDR